jgi:hypothetical protein
VVDSARHPFIITSLICLILRRCKLILLQSTLLYQKLSTCYNFWKLKEKPRIKELNWIQQLLKIEIPPRPAPIPHNLCKMFQHVHLNIFPTKLMGCEDNMHIIYSGCGVIFRCGPDQIIRKNFQLLLSSSTDNRLL